MSGPLVLPGTSGNYASIPDSAGLSPSSNITLLSRVAATDWTPAANQRLINKSVVGVQFSYIFLLLTTGKLRLSLSSAGTANVNADSSVAPTIADGATLWVLVSWRASDGRTQFFTASGAIASPVASDFTQLGTNQTLSVASIFDSSQAVELGSGDGGTANLFVGTYYRAMMYDGAFSTAAFGGTKQLDANFETVAVTGIRSPATFTESSTNAATVTINVSQWYWTSPSALVLPGVSGQYASAPDSSALSVTGDIDIRVKVALDDWTPAANSQLVAKWTVASNQRSYFLRVLTGGTLDFSWSTDGAATTSVTSSATGISDGATKWVRVTLDVDNGSSQRVIKFYTSDDGSAWSQLGSTTTTSGTTSIFDSSSVIAVGAQSEGTTNPTAGTFYRVQIRNNILDDGTGIVFDSDFTTAPITGIHTPTSFTESSSNAATVTINGSTSAIWNWARLPFALASGASASFIGTTASVGGET